MENKMSSKEITIIEIIDLCAEFKKASERYIETRPDLKAKATEVMTPLIPELEEVLQEFLMVSPEVMSGGEEAIKQDTSCQNTNLKLIDILAGALDQVFTKEEITHCLPEGLKSNETAAQLLESRNAPKMAKLCRL